MKKSIRGKGVKEIEKGGVLEMVKNAKKEGRIVDEKMIKGKV